jgi:hypothetical protein
MRLRRFSAGITYQNKSVKNNRWKCFIPFVESPLVNIDNKFHDTIKVKSTDTDLTVKLKNAINKHIDEELDAGRPLKLLKYPDSFTIGVYIKNTIESIPFVILGARICDYDLFSMGVITLVLAVIVHCEAYSRINKSEYYINISSIYKQIKDSQEN